MIEDFTLEIEKQRRQEQSILAEEKKITSRITQSDIDTAEAIQRETLRQDMTKSKDIDSNFLDAVLDGNINENSDIREYLDITKSSNSDITSEKNILSSSLDTPSNAYNSSISLDENLKNNGLGEFANSFADNKDGNSLAFEMARKIKQYVTSKVKSGSPVSFTGMVLHLGFASPEEYNEYDKIVGFSRILKMAKTYCANYIEEGMLAGDISPATGSFLLKSLHEWRDNVNINISDKMTEESRRVIIDADVVEAVKLQLEKMNTEEVYEL